MKIEFCADILMIRFCIFFTMKVENINLKLLGTYQTTQYSNHWPQEQALTPVSFGHSFLSVVEKADL